MAKQNGDVGKFKQALDKQNRLERARSGPAKRKRDAIEGEAAQHGLGVLEKHSKGRPKQTSRPVTAKKSPNAARSQSR